MVINSYTREIGTESIPFVRQVNLEQERGAQLAMRRLNIYEKAIQKQLSLIASQLR